MPELPSWYDEPWAQLLRRHYEEHGPTRTAKAIGYSPSVVIGIAKGSYPADPGRVREAVMAALSDQTVACPVLGDLPLAQCRQHRTAPFAATNPVRVRLFRTCPQCPHNPESHA